MLEKERKLTSPYTRTPQRVIMMIGTMNIVYQTAGLTPGFQNSISVAAALSSAGPVTAIMYPVYIMRRLVQIVHKKPDIKCPYHLQ